MKWLLVCTAFAMIACGGGEKPPAAPAAAPAAVPATPPAAVPATPPADPRPVIVAFGDSLSAGFGLDTGQSFPDLMQQDLDRRGFKYRVINMGISGDTTQDGMSRLPLAIAEKPAIVLLELGGNDGLRGVPIAVTQRNLAAMIEEFQKAGARVVLAGMTLPPNYGPAYISKFEAVYRDLAAKYKVTLIPFLLEGVGGNAEFMQRDGLHPNAAGARKVANLVMKTLEPMLTR
jgi:acyl-CoA thioesterase-1